MEKISSLLRALLDKKRISEECTGLYLYPPEKFKEGGKYDIDLNFYLKKFSKKDWSESAKAGYEIFLSYFHCDLEMNTHRIFGVFRDANYTLILCKDGRAIACIGFDIFKKFKKISFLNKTKSGYILIKQIQGVRGKQEELQPLRWEKMLLAIVVDWARAHRFKYAKVIKAKNNKWYYAGIHKKMYMKYDVTARRSGFVLDPKKQVYTLPLA